MIEEDKNLNESNNKKLNKKLKFKTKFALDVVNNEQGGEQDNCSIHNVNKAVAPEPNYAQQVK